MSNDALHVSGVQSFWECQRKWYYKNPRFGLGYSTPHSPNAKALLGTWVHYALALVYKGNSYTQAILRTVERQNEMEEMCGEWQGDRDKLHSTFVAIMNAHKYWQGIDHGWYADTNLEWLESELPFSVYLNDTLVEGILDGWVRHKHTGEYFVFERKTSSNPTKIEEGVLWDLQPRVYMAAARQALNIKPAGVIYELIKSSNINDVAMLRNGLPSKAKNTLNSTTYEVYLQKLLDGIGHMDNEAQKRIKAEYKDQLDYLRTNPDPLMRRTLHIFTDEVQQSATEFMEVSSYYINLITSNAVPPIPTGLNRHSCGYCEFKHVCQAQDDGADWRGMLGDFYVDRPDRFDKRLED